MNGPIQPWIALEIESEEDFEPVRYVYGLTSALLIGGAAVSLTTGFPAGAQVAQNDEGRMQQIQMNI